MTTATKPKSGYENWQDGINKAVGNDKWSAYDCEIQMAVNVFNRHLSGQGGYRTLDWQFIKTMMWVETGAEHRAWKSNPMQIGVLSDPGLGDLLASDKGGEIILPATISSSLNRANAKTIPSYNIRASIGSLLMKMANFATKSVPDTDTTTHEVTVKTGDSLDKIAKVQGSTIDVMKKLNPTAHVLRPGQVLKYQKASIKKVIIGWKSITDIEHRYVLQRRWRSALRKKTGLCIRIGA